MRSDHREATVVGKAANSARLKNIHYPNCFLNGSIAVTVDMNGCEYLFEGAGGTTDTAAVVIECPGTNVIELTVPNCTVKIGPQALKGAGYHTIGVAPTREVTGTAPITTSIKASANGVGCEALGISPTESTIGTYTTGNAIATGETEAGVMADAWYE